MPKDMLSNNQNFIVDVEATRLVKTPPPNVPKSVSMFTAKEFEYFLKHGFKKHSTGSEED